MKSLIFLVLLGANLVQGKTGCIDEDGNPVDMFLMYKLPKLSDEADLPHLDEGSAYAYMDSNNYKFRIGKYAITDKKNPVALTLEQIYSRYQKNGNVTANKDDLAHLFYNDENPVGHSSYGSYGHTKGAVAFDLQSGFWLIHSVPRFPPKAKTGYQYPSTGLRYGQSMMCMTFDSKLFDPIGRQLVFNHPHIHDNHLPTSFKKKFPHVYKVIKRKGQIPRRSPFYSVLDLQSSGGIKLRHFAKYTRFHKDLYHDLVTTSLKTDLLTETWQHGTDIGPSCDGDYQVEDISDLEMKLSGETLSFKTMQDHSKFAIGKTSGMPFVCIGDINRQPSQFKRGGGTMCVKNFDIWNEYYALIDSYIGCDDEKYNKDKMWLKKLIID